MLLYSGYITHIQHNLLTDFWDGGVHLYQWKVVIDGNVVSYPTGRSWIPEEGFVTQSQVESNVNVNNPSGYLLVQWSGFQ